jgi:hypothetical protein
MCVAVIVETDKGPSQLEMWQMDDHNPHGVGVAWCPPGSDLVRYKKGLKWKDAHELLQKIPRPALLHFRWATHGGQGRHLTHPFPLGPRALTSRKLNGAAKAVLIHNGVWQDYLRWAPAVIKLDRWSDTAVAAYAAGVYAEDVLDDVDWATAVARASGNGRMDITLRGDWREHEGNLYSNLHWRGFSITQSSFSEISDHYDRGGNSAFEEWRATYAKAKAQVEDWEETQKAIRAMPGIGEYPAKIPSGVK